MALAHEQASARAQQPRDDLGPSCDARQPADRADACEDEIESLGSEQVDGVVGIALDEAHIACSAIGERARSVQRRR